MQKTTLALAMAISITLCIVPMATATDNANQNMVSPNKNTNQNLQIGMTDQKVTEAQKWLKNNNYYNKQIDGYFGIYTENGVKQFQKAAGIKVDGIIGPQTIKAMNAWDQDKAQVKTTAKKSQKVSTMKVESKNAAYGTKKYNTKKAAYGTTKKFKSTKSYRYASGSGYIYGMDCWAMSSSISSKYASQGIQTRTMHAVTSLSSDHRWVQINMNGQWVNAPDYASLPWIYKPTG